MARFIGDLKSILVVANDKYGNASAVNNLLREMYGLKVDVFTDAELALNHFKQNYANYDIVLVHISLKNMTGLSFIRKLREIKPYVQVVLLSALFVNPSEFSKALPYIKIDGFLQRPVSKEQLNAMVDKLLGIEENTELFNCFRIDEQKSK